MTRRRAAAWFAAWVLAAGCHVDDPPEVAPQRRAGIASYQLTIVFEPPLSARGRLSVRHESGYSIDVDAPPSGVDLTLPAGPASLRLEVAGRAAERIVNVSPALGSLVWRVGE